MGALAGRPYGQIGELVTRFEVERERVPVPGFLDALLARMGMETRQAAQHREAVRNVQRSAGGRTR